MYSESVTQGTEGYKELQEKLMARPKKYKRPIDVIMQAEYVRLCDEATIRYPYSQPVLYRLRKEGRIRTFGSPETIHCAEFEAQMKADFPVMEGATVGPRQRQ